MAILAQLNAPLIASLEKLLGTPRDGALLRFSLGNEYLKGGDNDRAAEYLREAVERDPGYSAAWKLLGKSGAATTTASRGGIGIATRM